MFDGVKNVTTFRIVSDVLELIIILKHSNISIFSNIAGILFHFIFTVMPMKTACTLMIQLD